MSSHVTSPRSQGCVFGALLALLAITIIAAYLDLGPFGFPVALLVAVSKGLLIVWFFMELRFSSRLIWLAASCGFVWLFILLVLTFADYVTR